ncbi:MAG TPA: antitoxin family protein [Tepidisphaeraceae bacterium]|nr:antitoxin family protein [Tepidisphaeraceae bacterium]
MNKTIDAIYENGAFHPIEPVSIANGERVKITVIQPNAARYDPAIAMERLRAKGDKPDSFGDEGYTPEENQRVIDAILEIASLPDGQEDDGTGGDKHDEIIYGKQDDLP